MSKKETIQLLKGNWPNKYVRIEIHQKPENALEFLYFLVYKIFVGHWPK